jgi:arylsulfatase A-like enzyme
MKRRDLLKSTIAAPAILAGGLGEAEAAPRFDGMNVILFITDQERAPQHFPPGWVRRNQPATQQLINTGISFNRAFCSACMCSPSRASMMTGYFPAQHGVTDTLAFNDGFAADDTSLPLNLPNIATTFAAAGYNVVYKGKWHLSKPLSDPSDRDAFAPADAAQYGFSRWDPPDAGENQDISQFGGGRAANDRRFIRQRGPVGQGDEGTLAYLRNPARRQQPFCLIVSLVNPHDVLAYPRSWRVGGYRSNSWLQGDIDLPPTWNEQLRNKPTVQRAMLPVFAKGIGILGTRKRKLNYINFYGNLISEADKYLGQILEVLEETGLRNNTVVIKTSDHGEMGLAHGGLRQKAFNFYEETLRVPLIFSNPRLVRRRRQSNALVSHVDLLPTLASLFNVPAAARADWQGVDYSRIVNGGRRPVQDYVAFTFDDIRMAQNVEQIVPPPNRIVSLREHRYKLARYYDGDGVVPDQWEMYDLLRDPLERVNLAAPGFRRNRQQQVQFDRLQNKLAAVQATRLQPL